MNKKIQQVLEEKEGNYIFPFFWQHGESEETLRRYMQVIRESNIHAVCVESRPHPDFLGPKWWHDMDIILDEARKRAMKVWILDDSHFPSGYANGALKNAPNEYRRQSLTAQIMDCCAEGKEMELSLKEYQRVKAWEPNMMEKYNLQGNMIPVFDDDQIHSVIAFRCGGKGADDILNLSEQIKSGKICFTVPEGKWKLVICHLTRNRGPHRDYINMLDRQSCKIFIDTVYEAHYQHYALDFGKTIVGFFSDEPEIGNGHLYDMGIKISQMEDQAWSREVEKELKEKWGDQYNCYLPFIWEQDFSSTFCAKARYDYMNVVTRAVERNFSYQIGDWCRAHGVQYIGHLIEDNDQHTRTGSSLGHYFRGLAGQDMAGIDDIGGQVLPQGEELPGNPLQPRDGHFYHFALGKLASSQAAIQPEKKGRSMCEIFGNYGWKEGVRLEKYLIDHFLVRGINHFVPHAFSPKEFPDPDCPPHFYAHGNNPQYRHFGELMRYTNRMCSLISDGKHIVPVAILYHAEADWCGYAMPVQEPGMLLAEKQIDYDFIPADVFAEPEYYKMNCTNSLNVNGMHYQCLIIPECQFIPTSVINIVDCLTKNGFPVFFLNRYPEGTCEGETLEKRRWEGCKCVALEQLTECMEKERIREISVEPGEKYIRYLHYKNEHDLFLFVNEGNSVFNGKIKVYQKGNCYAYNAWENHLEMICSKEICDGTEIQVELEPLKPLVVIFDMVEQKLELPLKLSERKYLSNKEWKRSICRSIDYPEFANEKMIDLPDSLEKELPLFSGFVRYEKEIEYMKGHFLLEIEDASEGVEVFVNDVSAGIQIVPPYRYDLTSFMVKGKNQIRIEVATTLEREMSVIPDPILEALGQKAELTAKSGITGCVYFDNY